MAIQKKERGVHQSLVRPLFFAGGVKEKHLYLEGGIIAMCIAFMDLSWETGLVIVLIIGVVHPALVYMCQQDPLLPEVLGDSMGLQDYYPAQSEAEAKTSRSVPVTVPES